MTSSVTDSAEPAQRSLPPRRHRSPPRAPAPTAAPIPTVGTGPDGSPGFRPFLFIPSARARGALSQPGKRRTCLSPAPVQRVSEHICIWCSCKSFEKKISCAESLWDYAQSPRAMTSFPAGLNWYLPADVTGALFISARWCHTSERLFQLCTIVREKYPKAWCWDLGPSYVFCFLTCESSLLLILIGTWKF